MAYRVLLVVSIFLWTDILTAQNCNCCHLDDCPCRSECGEQKQTETAGSALTEDLPKDAQTRKVNTVESDVAGILTIKNYAFSIQQGSNSIKAIAIGEQIPYQFQDVNGAVVSGIYPAGQLRGNTMKLQLAAQLSEARSEKENQKWLRIINNNFLRIPGSEEPVEIGLTEVPVGWFQAFIKDTGYKTSAEVKGESIVRVLQGIGDRKKSGISWRHDPVGLPQSDVKQPVVHVSWEDAQAFCRWLSSLDPAYDYRLPTFKEWEWALGASLDFVKNIITEKKMANLADVSLKETLPYKINLMDSYDDGTALLAACGSFPPFHQLYDLIGNVAEWLEDNPLPHQPHLDKIVIGGSFFSTIEEGITPSFASATMTFPGIGFRLGRVKKQLGIK